MHETERLYNELNEELHRELPKFYNYRIDFIASNLSRLYSTESTFHSETGKVSVHVIQNPRFICGLLTKMLFTMVGVNETLPVYSNEKKFDIANQRR